MHIAGELAAGQAIDADIDHHRAVFHHVRRDHIRLARRDDQDIRLACDRTEVAGLGGADRDGRAAIDQHQRHRLAGDIAAADDHGVLTFDGNVVMLQHLHYAVGRAGLKGRFADDQSPKVGMMKPIDIFLRRNRLDDGLVIDVLRYRQLHQKAVDRGIVIQCMDLRQQFRLGSIGRHGVQFGMHADIGARLDFVAHINVGRGIVADDDDRQAGRDAANF